jgi:alanine dehydrogenase
MIRSAEPDPVGWRSTCRMLDLVMRIFIPKEVKTHEYRVAMVPAGVRQLVLEGHQVLIQASAGLGAGLSDEQFRHAGAQVISSSAEGYAAAELVIKVKEPQAVEYPLLRRGQLLFCYFHFAASRTSQRACL